MTRRDTTSTATLRLFMGRLRSDVRANTLAIMAAMVFPLAGLVGGGIDVARMYITKTRLQHACDAGALAGRKAMGGGTWGQNGNAPNASAKQFFDANYKQGSYGSSNRVRQFSENAGKVTGTASVELPMTLMKIFAVAPKTIAVTCSTEMRLPNTDIMFVLDTTGSMGDTPSGDSQNKMASLKVAVKCFYEIVARLDTNATCTTGTPGGGTGSEVQIRFGFVPYSTNVNVGRLLDPAWFANQWPYQSRAPRWWIRQGNPQVSSNSVSASNVPQSSCNDASAEAAHYNSNTDSYSNGNNTKTNTTVITHVTGWNSSGNGTCYGTQTKTVTTYNLQENVVGGANDQFIDYHYGKILQPIVGLKNGSAWNAGFQLPLGTERCAQDDQLGRMHRGAADRPRHQLRPDPGRCERSRHRCDTGIDERQHAMGTRASRRDLHAQRNVIVELDARRCLYDGRIWQRLNVQLFGSVPEAAILAGCRCLRHLCRYADSERQHVPRHRTAVGRAIDVPNGNLRK